jgi:hypothetical protein
LTADQTEFDAEAYDQREQRWIDARQEGSELADEPEIQAALARLWGES